MAKDENITKGGFELDSKKTPSSLSMGRSWFFGIGINQYDEFPDLNNAVKDVKDICSILQEDYDVTEETTVLLFDKEATRDNIITKLDWLNKQVKPNDKLIFYYSGHGHLNDDEKGFWIPTDGKKSSTAHYIRNSTIRDYIQDISALHTLLISDSCFSGSLLMRGGNRSIKAIDELETRISRWAICSGRHNEEVFDGEPGTNSPFCESIKDVLQNNKHPKFNVAKLADQVVELTRANYTQLPDGAPMYGVGHKGGQYIFIKKFDEAKEWEKTKAEHTIIAYLQYRSKFPSSPFAAQATEAIKDIEDTQAWEKALKNDTLSAYLDYQTKFPNGQFIAKAEERIQQKANPKDKAGPKAVDQQQKKTRIEQEKTKNDQPEKAGKGEDKKQLTEQKAIQEKSEKREQQLKHKKQPDVQEPEVQKKGIKREVHKADQHKDVSDSLIKRLGREGSNLKSKIQLPTNINPAFAGIVKILSTTIFFTIAGLITGGMAGDVMDEIKREYFSQYFYGGGITGAIFGILLALLKFKNLKVKPLMVCLGFCLLGFIFGFTFLMLFFQSPSDLQRDDFARALILFPFAGMVLGIIAGLRVIKIKNWDS